MSYPVIIRPEAESEIQWAQEYYFALSTELGEDLRLSVVESIERIAEHPELYAATYGKVRPVAIRRFPFILSYVFEFNRVVVIGLVHSSFPHETWNRRK